MKTFFVLLRIPKEKDIPAVQIRLKKILGDSFTSKPIDNKTELLSFTKGSTSIAILEASFSALIADCGDAIKGLSVPSASPFFYSYLDSVKPGKFTYLYQLIRQDDTLLDEAQTLFAGFSHKEIQTVIAYIESGQSPLVASYSLFVHKNTITNRINEFETKTGISLAFFPNRFFVYLTAQRYLAISDDASDSTAD
jgi:hypothetical protein